MKVYFDNAATTPLDPEVFEVMKPLMLENFGNPSSIHSHGRLVRSNIEIARKKIADLLQTSPPEIFFTSGGTEADNTALRCAVEGLGVRRIITSKIEHHAVLHTAEYLAKIHQVEVCYVATDGDGNILMSDLEALLSSSQQKTLVSLMHGNNEIGNLIDLVDVGNLVHKYGALFHSDTVQTMGHYVHDLSTLPVDFAVGSAHKFHGPKGVGFLYVHHGTKIPPFMLGGAQERNMRGGTENVYGIVGMAKALELAYRDMSSHKSFIESLKLKMLDSFKSHIPDVHFNGMSADLENSLYTVLNVCTAPSNNSEMLLFNLDISGISISGGSACSSGSNVGSHVLAELDRDPARGAIRFSFSRLNTVQEVEYAIEKLREITAVHA
ncbi:MAG: cysteine desulfurase [Cyclobacteriaceae bacterium]|jgi:cysteine desulfurase